MIVHLADLRHVRGLSARTGLCHAGARAWFARHGLDWNEFRRHGIDADVLLATGDGLAQIVVKQTSLRLEGARG